MCDVEKCEADPDWAHEINVQQLHRVIKALPEKTRLVYVSSDHVFGGDGEYDERSRPCPISRRTDAQDIWIGFVTARIATFPLRSLKMNIVRLSG